MAGNVGVATTSDATAATTVSANSETTRTGEANLADKDQEAVEQTITLETFGPILSEACKKLDREAEEEARRWEAIGEEGMKILQEN